MNGYKFKTRLEYLEWCSTMTRRLHIATITGNDDIVREVLREIASTYHVSERDHLIK